MYSTGILILHLANYFPSDDGYINLRMKKQKQKGQEATLLYSCRKGSKVVGEGQNYSMHAQKYTWMMDGSSAGKLYYGYFDYPIKAMID